MQRGTGARKGIGSLGKGADINKYISLFITQDLIDRSSIFGARGGEPRVAVQCGEERPVLEEREDEEGPRLSAPARAEVHRRDFALQRRRRLVPPTSGDSLRLIQIP